ncbi:tripartite tricarboxylate transporter substrate binding protein [Roseococcus sp. SDR]|uniref:Bug family tripartite tricarboxylate transporter substrate binding protein n=1 Tax=Roseococcus sp. SDR TaxID=2835532 RepID=UPI001BCCA057|nr:tripartite tricarboxylate transporter substrate binding protein [Roseococcus sp. SDR]MBS7791020.1 tripartite tricarboxylate transporter substrate binding protein [Roseococcus sp. SDR]MBV1846334.1 tripartite tricarboxylate transporter substrate binding protein [Roseococcus sp. SDR]
MIRRILLLLLLGMALPPAARAWPDRAVTIIIPFAPGNAADVITRLLAPVLSERWGQPVVVQNLPGASGGIGVERMVRAPADGHTLAMSGDAAVVVRASAAPRDLAQFLAAARAARGGFNDGHAGPGTSVQIASELLAQMTGLTLNGVGYPSLPAVMQDVMAGRLEFAFLPAVVAGPMVTEGRLRALGLSSPGRLAAFPDVTSLAEHGLPGFDASAWFGLLAPAATPAPVVARIHADVAVAFAAPAMRARLDGLGASLVANTPQEFAALIATEIPRMAEVLRRAGISGP